MLFSSNINKEKEVSLKDINFEALPSFKNASLKTIQEHYPTEILNIIQEMLKFRKNQHKFLTIDIKIHNLKKNVLPCLPNWHLDCTKDMTLPNPENHIICMFGDSGSNTEFIVDTWESSSSVQDFSAMKDYLNTLKRIELKESTIYTYNRHSFHRGTPAKQNGKRLFIRITESDIIRPRPIKLKPTYVKVV